jgi:threonyl-tRNA synthetase
MFKELSKLKKWELVRTPLILNSNGLKSNVWHLLQFEIQNEAYEFSLSRLIQHDYLFKNKEIEKEDLPIRFFEWVNRYALLKEPLTEGLLNSVCQSGDFSTHFSLDEQLNQEFISYLQFIEQIIRIFGFEAHWCFVVSRQKSFKFRQEKAALERIQQILQQCTLTYPLQDELFESDDLEGPRLELRVADEIGREWAISALTLIPYHLLKRNKTQKLENEVNVPFVLIKQVWKSLGRLIALLIERFEGSFPLWLAPEQVRILALGESSLSYAREIEVRCRSQGLRVGVDFKKKTKLSEKIHLAEKEKIPFLLIIGEQEVKRNAVTVRSVERPGKSESIRLEEFFNQICQQCVCPTLLDNNYEEERLD